ncbi:hypothetical protein FB45DRAFT_1125616 [Roridomyces roridus]|uniref:Uncharacterized protein n=1 Tax=Roridomyces roridus TaxID=1738132 RepID=A0AAD7C805_9AGAR|nr:hypothetical protein FB45DRAFT_1125616 [Roridomyces roridus]
MSAPAETAQRPSPLHGIAPHLFQTRKTRPSLRRKILSKTSLGPQTPPAGIQELEASEGTSTTAAEAENRPTPEADIRRLEASLARLEALAVRFAVLAEDKDLLTALRPPKNSDVGGLSLEARLARLQARWDRLDSLIGKQDVPAQPLRKRPADIAAWLFYALWIILAASSGLLRCTCFLT